VTAVTGSIEPPRSDPAHPDAAPRERRPRVPGPTAERVPAPDQARHAARAWWDAEADAYQAEHAAALGGVELVWGPEGWTEAELGLLGRPEALSGRSVLEVGCGAGQGSRWLTGLGALPVGLDLSDRQLRHAQQLDGGHHPGRWVLGDAVALPFAADSFDLAFASYGALQFVTEPATVHAEVARVVRPGGRWVFSVTHPIRWAFLDDPGPRGLTAVRSYFDRTPYVERDGTGALTYLESHRTLQDHVDDLRRTGFVLDRLVEPPWHPDRSQSWGPWSPERGRLLPGTAVFVTRLAPTEEAAVG